VAWEWRHAESECASAFARRARSNWLRRPAYATMYSSRIQRSATQFAASHDSSAPSSDVPCGAPPRHVVVVGGGVGGLAVACRLVARSRDRMAKPNRRQDDDEDDHHDPNQWKVTVLEKNDEIGGRCGSFFVDVPGRGTFRHERGPSLLLLPDAYRELFDECGSSMAQCGLHVRECSPAYQVVFDDGDRVNLGFRRTCSKPKDSDTPIYSEMELESRKALDVMEPNGAEKWDEYLRTCEAYLECGLPNFIEQRLDLASLPEFMYESLRDNAKGWPLQPHSSMLDKFFASNKLRALASFQDLYVGLEPYRNEDEMGGGVLTSTAPAIFGLLAAIEMHPTNVRCGVSAPVGGFDAVTRAMAALAHDLGVDVRCGKTVTKVAHDGVHVVNTRTDCDGSNDEDGANRPVFIPADLVVVNADLPYARQSLMKPEFDPDRAVYDWSTGDPGRPRYRFSSGVVAFHWSIGRELNDLNTHNVFLVASNRTEAEQSWRVLRDSNSTARNAGETTPSGPASVEPFNFYVHRASKTDPTAAPKVRAQYWIRRYC
jgi:phytoene desaturase (3,4-didehydrolycopene-forming)